MKIKFLDNLYQNSKKNIKDYKWTFLSIILICIYYMFKVIANKTLLLDSSKIELLYKKGYEETKKQLKLIRT